MKPQGLKDAAIETASSRCYCCRRNPYVFPDCPWNPHRHESSI